MEQRGRKSAASLGVVPRIAAPPSDPVQPLENLSEPARTAFINLVSSCEPTHFTNADIGLITQYASAQAMAEKALGELERDPGDKAAMKLWETSAKLMSSLALRLRIGPQSRKQYFKPKLREARPWEWEPPS